MGRCFALGTALAVVMGFGLAAAMADRSEAMGSGVDDWAETAVTHSITKQSAAVSGRSLRGVMMDRSIA